MTDPAFQSSLVLFGRVREERKAVRMPGRAVASKEFLTNTSSFSGIRTLHSPAPNCFARIFASTGETSPAAEDYKKFSGMLGGSSYAENDNFADSIGKREVKGRANPQSDAHAEFSNRLGTTGKRYSGGTSEGRETASQEKPRKAEINPEDYKIFDGLLERSGGTGRKPLKGSKRYMKKPTPPKIKKRQVGGSVGVVDNTGAAENAGVGDPGPATALQRPVKFTDQEKANAYAFMREEFGSGMHGIYPDVEREKDLDKDEKEEERTEAARLVSPPRRPSEAISADIERTAVESAALQSGVQRKDDGKMPIPPKVTRKQVDDAVSVVNSTGATGKAGEGDSGPATALQRPVKFTDQEKAKAYAFMREEFGSGMHGIYPDVEREEDLNEEEKEKKRTEAVRLVSPPRRPSEAISADIERTAVESAALQSGVQRKDDGKMPIPPKVTRKQVDDAVSVVNSTGATGKAGEGDSGPATALQRPVKFTDQEKAKAYAFMREEFGSGMHGIYPDVEREEDLNEEEKEKKRTEAVRLVSPPRRPSEAISADIERTAVESAALQSGVQRKDDGKMPIPPKVTRKQVDDSVSVVNRTGATGKAGEGDPGPAPALQRPLKLTEQEKAKAYAFMREEFGSGMHGVYGIEEKEEELNKDEKENERTEAVRLASPPRRPRDAISEGMQNTSVESADLRAGTQKKDDGENAVPLMNPLSLTRDVESSEKNDDKENAEALMTPPSRAKDVELSEIIDDVVGGSFIEANIIDAEMGVAENAPALDPLLPRPMAPSSFSGKAPRTTRLSGSEERKAKARSEGLARKPVRASRGRPANSVREGNNLEGHREGNWFDIRTPREERGGRRERAGPIRRNGARGTGSWHSKMSKSMGGYYGRRGKMSRGARNSSKLSVEEQKRGSESGGSMGMKSDVKRPSGMMGYGEGGETEVDAESRDGQRQKSRNGGRSAEVIGPGEMEVKV